MTMHVKIDPSGPAVEVDGTDITGVVRRATVDLNAGYPAEVFLEMAVGKLAPDVLNVEGVVHVVRDGDQREVVLAWLDTVDADALEQAVLAEADLGRSTGEAFVAELRKIADGQ